MVSQKLNLIQSSCILFFGFWRQGQLALADFHFCYINQAVLKLVALLLPLLLGAVFTGMSHPAQKILFCNVLTIHINGIHVMLRCMCSVHLTHPPTLFSFSPSLHLASSLQHLWKSLFYFWIEFSLFLKFPHRREHTVPVFLLSLAYFHFHPSCCRWQDLILHPLLCSWTDSTP